MYFYGILVKDLPGIGLSPRGISRFSIFFILFFEFLSVYRFYDFLRSFTLFAGKSHYMTIAATNENDVSAIVKKIDSKNKIRYEANAVKKARVVHKVIVNKSS